VNDEGRERKQKAIILNKRICNSERGSTLIWKHTVLL